MKSLFVPTGLLLTLVFIVVATAQSQPKEQIDPNEKCPVCGMFVARYPAWVAQLHLMNGEVAMFDGVKDMLKYYLEPQKYGQKAPLQVKSIYVRDYYTQEWIQGETAFYVIGSDVYGPMGHELIPFSDKEAASDFKKDHRGEKIILFNQIKIEDVNSM